MQGGRVNVRAEDRLSYVCADLAIQLLPFIGSSAVASNCPCASLFVVVRPPVELQ